MAQAESDKPIETPRISRGRESGLGDVASAPYDHGGGNQRTRPADRRPQQGVDPPSGRAASNPRARRRLPHGKATAHQRDSVAAMPGSSMSRARPIDRRAAGALGIQTARMARPQARSGRHQRRADGAVRRVCRSYLTGLDLFLGTADQRTSGRAAK